MRKVQYHFIRSKEDFERMVGGLRLKKPEEYLNERFSPHEAKHYRETGLPMIGGWDWVYLAKDNYGKQITVSTDVLGDYWKCVQFPFYNGVLSIMIPMKDSEDGKNRAPYQVFFDGEYADIENKVMELVVVFSLLEIYRIRRDPRAYFEGKRLNKILTKARMR